MFTLQFHEHSLLTQNLKNFKIKSQAIRKCHKIRIKLKLLLPAVKNNIKSFKVHRLKPILKSSNSEINSKTIQKDINSTEQRIDMVYKFGGSSLQDASRIREVFDIIMSFPENYPCIVLSAMGKTTNLLLKAAKEALEQTPDDFPLPSFLEIREIHLKNAIDLNLSSTNMKNVKLLIKELESLLLAISMLHELTPRTRDSVVSFGERLSTEIFSGYCQSQNIQSKRFDAWDLGFISTDEFNNSDVILELSLPKIKKNLEIFKRNKGEIGQIPIITGFVAKGIQTNAITTLGRGGSDLTATIIGLALDLKEVQVWKDVDGILTCDPRLVSNAKPLTEITYDEANELAYFGAQVLHPLAIRPVQISKEMAVRVKNSYNRMASGTCILPNRNMNDVLLTSIVIKRNVTVVDIISTKMLGQYGFLARVFEAFSKHKLSIDVVATSEISVSVTLDIDQIVKLHIDEDNKFMNMFKNWADVNFRKDLAIISLICNVEKSSLILEKVFKVLKEQKVNVNMISQGASKTNIAMIVDNAQVVIAAQAIHKAFFE